MYRSVSSILTICSAALAALVLVGGGEAWADPTPTVGQIEAQIAELWAKVEPQVEHYNLVHEQYLKNKARQAALMKQIEPLKIALSLAQVRFGAVAAQVYKAGDASQLTLLVDGDPQSFIDRLTLLDAVTREQRRELQGVTDLKSRYDEQKKPIDELVTTLAHQDADLATQRKRIDAQIAQLQALRVKAYGASGAIGSYRPWTCPAVYEVSAGYRAAAFACSQAGKPYVWAAAGPSSYDCSGLTLAAWAKAGIYLPHNAAAQYSSMPHISRSNLRIGDLVFYNSLGHVAIYVGDGHIMQSPQPGDVVHMSPIDEGDTIYGYGRPGG